MYWSDENKLRVLKLANLQSEQAAQGGSSSNGSNASKSNGASAAEVVRRMTAAAQDSADGPNSKPTIYVAGSIVGGTPDEIVRALTPIIIANLKQVQARTTGTLLGK